MFFNFKHSEFIKKIMQWAFYVFIAFFPFVFYIDWLFYGTSSKAINLVIFVELLAIGFGILLLRNGKDRLSILKSPITLSLLILLIVSFVSSLSGVDFQMSFWSKTTRMSGLFYYVHIGLFYLFITTLFNEESTLKKLLKVFLFSTGICSIGALLSKDGLNLILTDVTWSGFTFGNSSFAAMYFYAAFLLSVYFVAIHKNLSQKWWLFFIPLIFIINPYILNRDVWIGNISTFGSLIGEAQATSITVFVSIALLFVFWLLSKIKKVPTRKIAIWVCTSIGILFASIAIHSFLSTDGYLQKIYLQQASKSRPIVWNLSKESIKERPVFGWGVDNFDRSFEKNYDTALLEMKNGGEAWFDRAHNIFIDQTVETGYMGLIAYLLVYLSIFGSMIYVLVRSKNKNDQTLAVILIIYFIGHIMELQTGFDTTISYVPLALMAALSSFVFYKTYQAERGENSTRLILSSHLHHAVGGIFILGFGLFFIIGTVPIVRAQKANGTIHTIGSSEKRIGLYPKLFGSPVDKASFVWRTASDFQRGIAAKPSVLENENTVKSLIKELAIYENEYKKYALAHPMDYRVKISLANTYINKRLFNIDQLNEAHAVLDDAISGFPNMPQAYWMKSVTYLYQRKFDLAREWAKKAHDLNPKVEQSQKIINYIDESIRTFPDIIFFRFGQI